jgi:hypothetical protein
MAFVPASTNWEPVRPVAPAVLPRFEIPAENPPPPPPEMVMALPA